MTALCPGGGTSSPKAGLAEVVAVSSGAIALAMQRYGAARLQFLIPLLGLAPLELDPFCNADPPAMPTFTSDEVYSLLRVGLDADYFSGLSKARDMVMRMLWADLCQCDSGTATAPTAPSLPTNTPNPITPAPASGVPCFTYNGTPNAVVGYPQQTHATYYLPPAGKQPTMMALQTTAATGSGYYYKLGYTWNNGTTLTSVKVTGDIAAGTLSSISFPLPSSYISELYLDWWHDAGTQVGTCDITMNGQVYCNGELPGLQQPCCPPDAATQSSLDLILQMVTLIQRQSVPFGYIATTVHSGLSGAGAFDIAGLIGAAVNVTTIPDSYGRAGSNPTEYFDLGFVTFGTDDGWPTAYKVQRQNNLLLPARCSAYTDLEYDLSPGVVATITELVREP